QVRGKGDGSSRETPVGIVPTPQAIGADDIGMPSHRAETLLSVDREAWLPETEDHARFLEQFGDRLPPEIRRQERALVQRLSAVYA
ncbi:MAG: phosphoenolpyruvate carboxykinase (GTP), partial [Chloroflexi bacterium]|nr:phosphoenolpyruvate carboxykinase (GTP) [Chloroflexota bacterium]